MTLQQSVGRFQRAKGFKIKTTVQVILLSAVCIWLLYQIKISYFKSDSANVSSANKLSKKHGSMGLGRKVDAGSDDEVEIDSDDEEKNKEDGGDGDDELDKNSEKNVTEESVIKDHEEPEENVTDGSQQEESQSKEEDNSDVHVKDGSDVHVKDEVVLFSDNNGKDPQENNEDAEISLEESVSHTEEDEEDPGKQQTELENNERENTDTQTSDGSQVLVSDKDGDHAVNEEEAMSPRYERESGTGVLDFHDENGIPPGSESLGFNIDEINVLDSDNRTMVVSKTLPVKQVLDGSSHPYGGDGIGMPNDNKVTGKDKSKLDESGSVSQKVSTDNGIQVGTGINLSNDLEISGGSDDKFEKTSIN